MSKFLIEGGNPLNGSIAIGGCKNAALPILAAALIPEEPSLLRNIPDTSDINRMTEIIASTGAHVKKIDKHTWEIGGKNIKNSNINPELAKKMRASILLVSPILAKCGKITFPHPGGCVLGQRPVDIHFEALRALGVEITADDKEYNAQINDLKGTKMFLDEVSVTATENALMLASVTPGETIIEPASCEPHVVDLANFLIKAGAKIYGAGTHTIQVVGVPKLHGVDEYSIIPDNIEAGTYAIAGIATKGSLEITNVIPDHLNSIVHKLKQMGANIRANGKSLYVLKQSRLTSARIQIDTWPRLPTDLQAPFAILATQAYGTSLIHDWMYEKRQAYIDDLIKMGANVTICDPHRALITGPTKLYGTKMFSPDIRAGIALVIAALIAEGRSELDHIELIDRGYENLDGNLRKLGANIKRLEP